MLCFVVSGLRCSSAGLLEVMRCRVCVFCLCRWYFAVISMSGVFAVTFSVIFAYVADITQEHERSTAYGLVRGTARLIPHSPNTARFHTEGGRPRQFKASLSEFQGLFIFKEGRKPNNALTRIGTWADVDIQWFSCICRGWYVNIKYKMKKLGVDLD